MTPQLNDQAASRSKEGALAPYLRAIQAHKVVFAVIVLVAVAAAGIWIARSQKEYSATAQVLITPIAADNQTFLGFELLRETGDPTRTVQTAAALIETQEAADTTARKLKNGESGDQILEKISVQPEGESNILDVTATADSPNEAAQLANVFVESSLAARRGKVEEQAAAEIERLEPVEEGEGGEEGQEGEEANGETSQRINQLRKLEERGDPTLSVAQKATPSDSPVGAGAAIVIVLAVIAGLLIATGTAVVLELTAHRIRDEIEATDLYPLPIIARVPLLGRREKRQRDSGTWPLPPRIREPFRTVMTQIQRDNEHRVIMLTSGSSGDGKTTSAINLAMTLALGGHQTILFDSDLRKPDVHKALQLPSTSRRPHAFDPKGGIEQGLITVPHLDKLRIFAVSEAQDEAELDSFGSEVPRLLEEATEQADYVVVDTPPLGEVSDALRIAPYTSDVLLVVFPGNTNRANFEIMRDLMERSGDRPTGFLVIGDRTGASTSYYGYGMQRGRAISDLSSKPLN